MGIFTREPDAVSAQAKPYSTPRAMTASASRLNLRDRSTSDVIARRRSNTTWQSDAWMYYDAIGEIKYAYKLFTNVLSRIRLYGAVVEDEDQTPWQIRDSELDEVVKSACLRAMRKLFSGANQAEILRKAGVNMLVAGECYLIQLPPKYGVRDEEQWKIISVDELVTRNGKYYYKSEENQRATDQEEIPESAFTGRIWNSHARFSDQADSSMRSL